MMDFSGHMSTGGWILSVLGILILVALVVAMIVLVVSGIDGRHAGGSRGQESAREILDRRLARGELTIEQYDEVRAAVDTDGQRAAGPPPSPRPADAG
jgi:uncharacterized membrane protein